MPLFAIADLHLAISVPEKDMGVFGPQWSGYMEKIAASWKQEITEEDLVLIAGDISWAMHAEDAKKDLAWIGDLPGTKVMIRGNHDYWWGSLKKVRELCPPSIHPLHHTAWTFQDIAIAGTRLWDSPDFPARVVPYTEEDRKIYERELGRLEIACQALDKKAKKRIVMTHFPPLTADLKDSPASAILERYEVDICLFGHLHNLAPHTPLFGKKNGVQYLLTSADYLGFLPLKLSLP
ncbi:MAG: metallophosphoesterase [Verrucomicrobia bacterium]|nr:metallophosphoesterase [Verrucomicrobiota bacterium]